MKRFIVTTTIHPPSEAILRFARMEDWTLLIVGDLRTPHQLYEQLQERFANVQYLSPEFQDEHFRDLSDAIGWRSIQRRNVGFVEAYRQGAEIVATVDDDNIPYENWGRDVVVGREIEVDLYHCRAAVFDPLSVTSNRHLWHRGYPLELLQERHDVEYIGKIQRRALIQADLWDGDPDIDAIARLVFQPVVKFADIPRPYTSDRIAPFNSQNTFLAREVLPLYAVFPHVGRMDDIWGAYIVQRSYPESVVFNRASVRQERNAQDLITNLENEIIGYRQSMKLLRNLDEYESILPPESVRFYKIYRDLFL